MRASRSLVTLGILVLIATAAFGVLRSLGGGGGSDGSERVHAVTNQLIAFYEERIERDPADFVSYTKLGESHARQARETGDPTALGRAEAALTTALEIRPGYLPAKASLANVRLSVHDFTGALDLAREVYEADPAATAALATIGDAHIALGNYEEGRAAYEELSRLAGGPSVDARLAHLAELSGDTDEAVRLMRSGERAVTQGARSAETIAWHRTQLAELLLESGRVEEARRYYNAALDAFPDYVFALGGLAASEVALGDHAEAIDLYERALAARAEPPYEAALGDLYALRGDERAAGRHYDEAIRLGELEMAQGIPHVAELVLLYADAGRELESAVELALSELERRQDIYTYDAAAWALYAAGRAEEAAPLADQALRLGTKDARILFHSGMIRLATGDRTAGEAHLQQALDINPTFSVRHAQLIEQVLASR